MHETAKFKRLRHNLVSPVKRPTYLGLECSPFSGLEAIKMCGTDRENSRINGRENCEECGSKSIEEGVSHYHCGNCGIQLESLKYDTCYTFPSEVKTTRRTNSSSDLGSQIGIDKSSSYQSRRLAALQDRHSRRNLSYTDKIVKEAEIANLSPSICLKIADIISKANSRMELTHNRDGMIGLQLISTREDRSQYRRRVYAIAALELLNRNLESEAIQVLEIASEWGIDKSDVSQAIKLINKVSISVNDRLSVSDMNNQTNDPSIIRNEKLYHFLFNFQDHLCEIINFDSAKGIIASAIEILSKEGEPIGNASFINNEGKYRNMSPQKASMETIIDSMIHLGYSDEIIKCFFNKKPVPGMTWVNSRLGRRRRALVED